MLYKVVTGTLTVTARSSVHDTRTVWHKVTGEIDADPDAIETATATFSVDMTAFDAGDWLKNRKLRKDFDLAGHPIATFELQGVSEVVGEGAKFTANANGVLRWRGKEVVLQLAGQGTLDRELLEATATFGLDIKRLGLEPPRFFVFKMEAEVTVAVALHGVAA